MNATAARTTEDIIRAASLDLRPTAPLGDGGSVGGSVDGSVCYVQKKNI